jgi:hypothetical protein
VNLALNEGTNEFTLIFQHNGDWPAFGVNLFFDNRTVASISAKAPLRTGASVPAFSANSAPVTYSMTSYPAPNAPASGTLSATFDRQVTLTQYYTADRPMFSLDRVSTHSVGPNGRVDYVATITLVAGPSVPQQSGFVNFANNAQFTTMADRRVYADFIGGTPLVGTNWAAQLYYGANASALIPVTNPPAFFRPPGTIFPGTWVGGNRTLYGFGPGAPVTLQVRVWDRSRFPTYETAVSAGGAAGVSTPFSYITPSSVPPHPSEFLMENLRAFALSTLPPPTNRPPVAISQNVTTAEDTALAITLSGSDPEGDRLTFSVPATQSAQGGTLVHSAGVVQYTPPENFFGDDQFGFVVSDGQATASGTVRIQVTSVNDAPMAVAHVGPLLRLTPGETNLVVLSINGSNAAVVLDASQSSDVDTTALGFIWSTGDPPALLTRGEVVTNLFEVGSHIVTLVVTDGDQQGAATVVFDVVTVPETIAMVSDLLSTLPLERRHQRPLTATLKAALQAFDRGDHEAAFQQLEIFVHKLENQVARTNPETAETLLRAVGALLAAWVAQESL